MHCDFANSNPFAELARIRIRFFELGPNLRPQNSAGNSRIADANRLTVPVAPQYHDPCPKLHKKTVCNCESLIPTDFGYCVLSRSCALHIGSSTALSIDNTTAFPQNKTS